MSSKGGPLKGERRFLSKMLPLKNRLLAKKDFNLVKTEGEKLQGKFFALLFYQTGNDFSRFGFIFSKKLSKKAVERNHSRRLFREATKGVLPGVRPGFDFLFLGTKEALNKSLLEVQVEIKTIFKKAGVLDAERKQ